MSTADPIRLVIIDDHEIVRAGLRSLLRGAPGIRLVGEAADGISAVALVESTSPSVVLVDLRMPGMDGLAIAEAIRSSHPEVAVALLTMFDDIEFLERAIQAGAAGYLLKGIERDDLLSAIRRLASGAMVFDPALIPRLVPALRASRPQPNLRHSSSLTVRELDVLREIVAGRTNAEIGRALGVSIETVKTHVHRIIQKFDAVDRTQAAVIAVAEGIVQPERRRPERGDSLD